VKNPARIIKNMDEIKTRRMKTIHSPTEMQTLANSMREKEMRIGFVPTMGYLHEGHLSLIREARKQSDAVVLSIFVNPTQFGPDEDLDKYPRDFEGDEKLAEETGADYIFYPEPDTMYGPGYQTYVKVEELANSHCGISRPVHFRGVATVCTKLFNLVLPHRAYFGQKDYQQCAVMKRMVRDLNMNLEIVVLPTFREDDGLAMSSRNAYLGPEERKEALCLRESLDMAREMVKSGETDARAIISTMRKHIESKPSARVDYISITDTNTLEELETIKKEAVALLAVFVGKTRLIDNEILKVN